MADLPPVDAFLAELDGLAVAGGEQDRLGAAVGAGTAPRAVARRAALEAYHLARWTTPECALLVANAPDVYAFTMDDAAHYRRWARELAARTGYLADGRGRPSRALCHEIGLGDDDVKAHEPLPETIAAAFTMVYYVRRSYEEGLAVLAFGWERCPAGRAHEEALVRGLRAHYPVRGEAARGEPAPGGRDGEPSAVDLFRGLALAPAMRERCREAVRNVLLVFATRVRAMNAWLAA